MSDQPKDQSHKKRAVRLREPAKTSSNQDARPAAPPSLDSAATAALALAVSTAEKAATSSDAPAPATAKIDTPPALRAAPGRRSWATKRPLAAAAAVLLVLTGGWLGTQAGSSTGSHGDPRWAEAAGALRQSQEDVLRLTGDVKALKVAIEALKESVDRGRSETGIKQTQLIERLDRAPQDATARIGQLSAQLDRIEAVAKDPSVRLASIAERMDRIENQMAAAGPGVPAKAVTAAAPAAVPIAVPAPPPAVPEAPAQTGSLDPKSLDAKSLDPKAVDAKAKDMPVDGWVLHEVYDGIALIESRSRRLIEVGPGEMVPGIGRVEAIERRGKRWVVVTAKGVISTVR